MSAMRTWTRRAALALLLPGLFLAAVVDGLLGAAGPVWRATAGMARIEGRMLRRGLVHLWQDWRAAWRDACWQ